MDKVSDKKKILILFVTIIAFVAVLAGGTYAWMSFTGAFVGNNGNTLATCFVIEEDYTDEDGTTSLNGTLIQSSKPKSGLSGTVGMKIRSDCGIAGVGHIYLTVNENTDSVLYKKAPARCENPLTLETMTGYDDSSSCASAGGTWVPANTHSALKYAVYENIDDDPVSVGYIDGTGKMTLHGNFELSYLNKLHYIYIWLDGNLADNTYVNVSFDGYIHLGANQTEDYLEKEKLVGDAYAIVADDGILRFVRSETPITVGSIYDGNGMMVTEVYTGFENESYSSHDEIPWESGSGFYYNVIFEDEIRPISTAYWFSGFVECTYYDLYKLDTSEVTNMSKMFSGASIVHGIYHPLDLTNFDTSNVTDMSYMFSGSNMSMGLDISGWDTSNVTDMSYMFEGLTLDTLNVSGFDTSNVTNMSYMFYGLWNENISIIGLEDWDTSSVTDMSYMLFEVPITADLSGWNVCNVTNYTAFSGDPGIYESAIISPYFGNTSRCNGGNPAGGNSSSSEKYSGEAIAIYSATDNSLRFYRTENPSSITVGSTYNGRAVTEVYTDFEDSTYFEVVGTDWDASFYDIITFEDYIYPISIVYWFENFTGSVIDLTKLDTSRVTNMSFAFGGINYLNDDGHVGGGNGTGGCVSSPARVDISNFDTSNVTNMRAMFASSCLDNVIGIENLDTSNVTDMSSMFGDTSIETLNVSNWDTSNVTDMSYMFRSASIETLNVSNWDTSKVTNMSQMFWDIGIVEIIGIENWDTSNVTDMSDMFNGMSIETLNVSNWDTSNVTDMSYMFRSASIETLNVSNWDTSKVTNMFYMFNDAEIVELIGIEFWDTSNVTDMQEMFAGSNVTTDLRGWNVCNVTSYDHFRSRLSGTTVTPNNPYFGDQTKCRGGSSN